MDVSNIEQITKIESKPFGSSKINYYVNVTKSTGQRIKVIQTEDEKEATNIYTKLQAIAQANTKAIQDAIAPQTQISWG